MKRSFIGIFLVGFVAVTVFIVGDQASIQPGTGNSKPATSEASRNNQLSKLKEEAEKTEQKGAQSEIDQVEREFAEKINEMDAFLKQAAVPTPKEYMETAEEAAEFEALISKIEQETGQKFSGDLESFELNPVEHKEYYELEQKFEALDDQMQQIVNEL